MAIVTTYPGVYIEEPFNLSLSVSPNATAVPAFAIADSNADFTSPVTRITSWMDFSNKVGEFDPLDVVHACIRTYFENGGGMCYLVHKGDLLSELPRLSDVTLLVSAGLDIASEVLILCGTGNGLFAIIDGPKTELGPPALPEPPDVPPDVPPEDLGEAEDDTHARAQDGSAITWLGSGLSTPYAAVYYPWLVAPWTTLDIPPSATMAGIYNMVDVTRGVWKAPANVPLHNVRPKFPVTDELQGFYTKGNDAINMIRVFQNGPSTVWGARTREDSDDWRYVPVRRLFNSAERDIGMAMGSAMFEPNSQPTWELVRSAITNYLYRLWQQGALAGATAEEAFFVRIGRDITMTQEEIDEGIMIVKVGMAAVRPAEFIILQFTQNLSQ